MYTSFELILLFWPIATKIATQSNLHRPGRILYRERYKRHFYSGFLSFLFEKTIIQFSDESIMSKLKRFIWTLLTAAASANFAFQDDEDFSDHRFRRESSGDYDSSGDGPEVSFS